MSKKKNAAVIAGMALGFLYLVEALFVDLFLLWPILGGVFAAALVSWNQGGAVTAGEGASAGAKAGVVGGLVLLVVGTPLGYYLLQQLDQEPGFFGISFNMGPLASLLVIFTSYSLFGIIVAAAAGAITGALRGRAGRSSDQSGGRA